LHTCHPHR